MRQRDEGYAREYTQRARRRADLRRRIGRVIVLCGASLVVLGAVAWTDASGYLRQQPPETLPGALVMLVVAVGVGFLLAGLTLLRWR
jgi:uncharacterized membrane protein YidH (DUF202 family)